jgi:hypothetical protein
MGPRARAWLRGFASVGEGMASAFNIFPAPRRDPRSPLQRADDQIAESWRQVGADLERAMRDIDEATEQARKERRP